MPVPSFPLIPWLDPRGRCNRKGLLLASGVLLAIEAVVALSWLATGMAFEGVLATLVRAGLLWMAFAATSKRLHDIGQPAWWLLVAAFTVMAWCFLLTTGLVVAFGAEALAPDGGGFTLAFVASCLPAAGGLLWLHCQPGESSANRYGPPPGPDGFSKVPVAAPAGDGIGSPA